MRFASIVYLFTSVIGKQPAVVKCPDTIEKEYENIKSNNTVSENDLFNDYKWLNTVLQNKISPVLLGKLEEVTQTDKFETAKEFEDFLGKSLDKLSQLTDDKKTDVNSKATTTKQ